MLLLSIPAAICSSYCFIGCYEDVVKYRAGWPPPWWDSCRAQHMRAIVMAAMIMKATTPTHYLSVVVRRIEVTWRVNGDDKSENLEMIQFDCRLSFQQGYSSMFGVFLCGRIHTTYFEAHISIHYEAML